MAKLTVKQEAFVKEYLKDLNAKQAAIRAGYSAKTAEGQGSRLLSNAKVAEFLQEAMKKRSERTEITADRVLEELGKIAFSDLKKVMQWDEDGEISLRPMDEVDGTILSEISETINETEFNTRRTRKVKLHDKMKALDLLGKHLGMWTEKLDVTGDLSVNINIDYGEDE